MKHLGQKTIYHTFWKCSLESVLCMRSSNPTILDASRFSSIVAIMFSSCGEFENNQPTKFRA